MFEGRHDFTAVRAAGCVLRVAGCGAAAGCDSALSLSLSLSLSLGLWHSCQALSPIRSIDRLSLAVEDSDVRAGRVVGRCRQSCALLICCCAVLCCAVLCCAVLCCAVLCCAVLCCAVLCCSATGTLICRSGDMPWKCTASRSCTRWFGTSSVQWSRRDSVSSRHSSSWSVCSRRAGDRGQLHRHTVSR